HLQHDHHRGAPQRVVRPPALHALRAPGLRLRLPHHRAPEDRPWARGVQQQPLHRLPGVHAGLPLPHPQVRLREPRAPHSQVHVLRRPHRGAAQARVRHGVPHRCHQLRRPGRHGGGSQAPHRHRARPLHPRDLRARRGGRDQRAPPLLGALRAAWLHHGAAEGADAGPHAPVAPGHAARVRPSLRALRRARVDRAPPQQEPGARGAPRVSVQTRLSRFGPMWDALGVGRLFAGFRLTWWDLVLLAIMAVGAVLTLIRYATGIASVANINNAYPWGWWVGFGIMTMIAVGGVDFPITLLAGILCFPRFHPIVRPAVLMAFLCYTSAIVMLMVELGRPWMVWMILVSWAPTAALYEVGWCAFLYLSVLAIEFAQVPAEELGWGRALRVIRTIYMPIMLLGVTLSHLHQSSLGTLMVLIPHKINVLWWSENLPLLFLFPDFMAGPALAILEHLLA